MIECVSYVSVLLFLAALMWTALLGLVVRFFFLVRALPELRWSWKCRPRQLAMFKWESSESRHIVILVIIVIC